MRIDTFVARRRAVWQELEVAVTRNQGRIGNLSTTELERFGLLYRHATSDLAIARRDHPGTPVADYLNGLCTRAHPLVFRGAPARRLAAVDLYRRVVPRACRAAAPYLAVSAGLLCAGAAAGWAAIELRPDLRAALVPASLFDEMARGQVRGSLPDASALSPVIILNNIRIALFLFAGGVLVGVPTAAVLLINGWTLGTLAAAVNDGGYNLQFWSLIAPHGVVELSIIAIAGGTGLMLGDSVLRPGLRRRSDALLAVAGRAIWLALGAATLLVVAGVLEGYVSPSGLAPAVKLTIGGASGMLLWSWLLLSGRRSADEPVVGP